MFLDWTFLPPETHSLRLACFDSLLQQPFVVVRHAADVQGSTGGSWGEASTACNKWSICACGASSSG